MSGSLSIDDVLEVLVDRRRRLVLEYCVSVSGQTVELDDLVEHIAQRRERTGKRESENRIRLSLHHVHLPMLASKGVVEFDPRSGHLRYSPEERLEAWLDRIRAAESDES